MRLQENIGMKKERAITGICCSTLLFTSSMKFDSDAVGPRSTPSTRKQTSFAEDRSHGMHRTEVRCSVCDAHLGHVFNDGPAAYGGERYCINSAR